jgi:septal ring factor EnvC (AmiA/AmiB activator)
LKTAKRAQVVAPFPGRVEFSGEFNDDNVVILNVGNGYFIVMTGLGETFASAGDSVAGGEPLGIMPSGNTAKPEFFMEFRKDRASIDPSPWIGTALAKAG